MKIEDHTPPEVKTAIEDLVRLCGHHKVAIAGFAFGAEPPFMVNFGTVSDCDDIRLYTQLCEMTEYKKRRGLTIGIKPGMIQ